ncbi:cytochrome c biogenesis protein CcsA [Oscillatoria amoena NRMC-F 0135]|nr:cytochrome c biogenesis protein CcsA [Oscillatoria amoena NRMC-F 0135]
MTDRGFIIISVVFYALSVGTLLGMKKDESHRLHAARYLLCLAGFLCQSFFLVWRSAEILRCPLTNLFEAFVFITWTMGLIYLVIGRSYRLSILGIFTLPMLLLLNLFALVSPLDKPSGGASKGFWTEMHAPLSVMSYGAFAIAAATGAMYLLQQYLLKSHKITEWVWLLPSVAEMEKITTRLLLFGMIVYTAGLASGFIAGAGKGWSIMDFKTLWSLLVWALYGILFLGYLRSWWTGRKAAYGTVILFCFVIFTFWGAYLLSPVHR